MVPLLYLLKTRVVDANVVNERTLPLWYIFIPTYKNKRILTKIITNILEKTKLPLGLPIGVTTIHRFQ